MKTVIEIDHVEGTDPLLLPHRVSWVNSVRIIDQPTHTAEGEEWLTFDFACKDDCLDRMVPSDLRRLVSQRDALRAELSALKQSESTTAQAENYSSNGRLISAKEIDGEGHQVEVKFTIGQETNSQVFFMAHEFSAEMLVDTVRAIAEQSTPIAHREPSKTVSADDPNGNLTAWVINRPEKAAAEIVELRKELETLRSAHSEPVAVSNDEAAALIQEWSLLETKMIAEGIFIESFYERLKQFGRDLFECLSTSHPAAQHSEPVAWRVSDKTSEVEYVTTEKWIVDAITEKHRYLVTPLGVITSQPAALAEPIDKRELEGLLEIADGMMKSCSTHSQQYHLAKAFIRIAQSPQPIPATLQGDES